jgi:hypothetical protein
VEHPPRLALACLLQDVAEEVTGRSWFGRHEWEGAQH